MSPACFLRIKAAYLAGQTTLIGVKNSSERSNRLAVGEVLASLGLISWALVDRQIVQPRRAKPGGKESAKDKERGKGKGAEDRGEEERREEGPISPLPTHLSTRSSKSRLWCSRCRSVFSRLLSCLAGSR